MTYRQIIEAFKGRSELQLRAQTTSMDPWDGDTYVHQEVHYYRLKEIYNSSSGEALVEMDDLYGVPCLGHVVEIVDALQFVECPMCHGAGCMVCSGLGKHEAGGP